AVSVTTPDPTAADTIVGWSILPQFPQRLRPIAVVLPTDVGGGDNAFVASPGANNFDLSASSAQTGHLRIYAVATGSALFSATIYAIRGTIFHTLDDPWN